MGHGFASDIQTYFRKFGKGFPDWMSMCVTKIIERKYVLQIFNFHYLMFEQTYNQKGIIDDIET